jgi:hypothetical protein
MINRAPQLLDRPFVAANGITPKLRGVPVTVGQVEAWKASCCSMSTADFIQRAYSGMDEIDWSYTYNKDGK